MTDPDFDDPQGPRRCMVPRAARLRLSRRFEAVEGTATAPGPWSDRAPGRFEVTDTKRHAPDGSDAGGGLMSVMRGGRVFEKVGVNVSAVYGPVGRRGAAVLDRAQGKFRGWTVTHASGPAAFSFWVAHIAKPACPLPCILNTRMFWTPGAWWFGGGTDLNPCIEYPEDTADFHATLKAHCDPHGPDLYPRFKEWADEYFYIPHRKRARGVGGIFYDDYCTGDWDADFAFTQDVGKSFLPAFLAQVDRRRGMAWTDADKETQLIHRGLYAEYNLVYDRGTKFGLQTGHDPDAVLMSLPPFARWV